MPKTNPDDVNEIDLDEELAPVEIMQSARKSFRFGDKLQGIKHRHGKVPVFTDMPAVDEYQELNQRAQAISDAAGRVDLKAAGGPERHEALLAEYNRLETLVEEARSKMLESAFSIHLKAWPSVAAKVAQRDARKKFNDEQLGGVPPERQVEASEYVDMQLIGASIVKIVDAHGNEDFLSPYTVYLDENGEEIEEAEYDKKAGHKKERVNPRETIGKELSDKLPPSQWERFYDAYQKLTLTDQIAESSTDDPGF